MRIDVLTLFPKMFIGFITSSIIKIAIEKKILDVRISDIRNFSYHKHRKVDDRPYGGGPGMLLKPEPIFRAVEAVWHPQEINPLCILLTPQGEVFHQALAEQLSKEQHLIMICGHYEGVDERVRTGLKVREISIGDYVLTGGEVPAMTIIDAVTRLIPGVLGRAESAINESFSGNRLEYPQYTKPREWRGMEVPEILYSGHHGKIQEWQNEMAEHKTKERRPDLQLRNK